MRSETTVTGESAVRWNHGYTASIILHAAIIIVAVCIARMAPRETINVDGQDPLLLEVWTGDGSERDPGIPGRDRGIADGSATGNKSKVGPGGMPNLRMNASKLLKELRDNDAKAAAMAAAEAKAAKESKESAKSDTREKASDKTSKTSTKESLADWKKAHPHQGKTAVSPSSGSHTGTAHGKIGGTSVAGVKLGTGKGSGEDGFGRSLGKGKYGGDGGSGNALKLFVGDVKGKFNDAYGPLFREQGSEISGDKDVGIVEILVSPSGLVRFSKWVDRPSNELMERIVLDAISKMRPVRPPPDGEETRVEVTVSGRIKD